VYYEKDPNKKTTNYILLRMDTKQATIYPSYLVFTTYKTSEDYHRVDEVIPKQAYIDIKDSLRRHPRTHLFITRLGKPFASNNAFSKWVMHMFDTLFGKGTGVTMLRHIYITEKIDFNVMNDEELEEVSHQMMHSRGLQRKYNWSKPKICEQMQRMCGTCDKG
jgi:hypothetical protein